MIPIFVAIDTSSQDRALAWLHEIGDAAEIKLGLEYFIANGADECRIARTVGATRPRQLFLDLKLHDIPITVSRAIRSAMHVQPDFITLHTSGGVEMMRAAVDSVNVTAQFYNYKRPKLLGVTVLTSLVTDIGTVIGRAMDAKLAGLDGVVCSPHEVRAVRYHAGDEFFLMTPGILQSGDPHDQKRVATARQAMDAGANGLVIGRAITAADDPKQALHEILATLTD